MGLAQRRRLRRQRWRRPRLRRRREEEAVVVVVEVEAKEAVKKDLASRPPSRVSSWPRPPIDTWKG